MTLLHSGDDTTGEPLVLPAMDPCILVVDDSSELRRVVARALREAGYAVLEAVDGAVALQILERGGVDIDLVLTDIKMPRLDGVELGRRIAERKWRVPVLNLSEDTGEEFVADGAGHPAAPLLQKPFSMSTLLDMVDRLRTLRGSLATSSITA